MPAKAGLGILFHGTGLIEAVANDANGPSVPNTWCPSTRPVRHRRIFYFVCSIA